MGKTSGYGKGPELGHMNTVVSSRAKSWFVLPWSSKKACRVETLVDEGSSSESRLLPRPDGNLPTSISLFFLYSAVFLSYFLSLVSSHSFLPAISFSNIYFHFENGTLSKQAGESGRAREKRMALKSV